jgi:hypothetical protein
MDRGDRDDGYGKRQGAGNRSHRSASLRGAHGGSGGALYAGFDLGLVVPFVLCLNFLAGFACLLAGLGLRAGACWAQRLSLAIFLATFAVLLAIALHVMWGGG